MAKGERATLTIEEAAKLLGVSRGTAYESARRGELPTLRLGRRLLVPRARLEELLGGDVEQMNNNGTGAGADPVGNQETSREVNNEKRTRPL
jgi:excisionase family DNA binding protein